MIKIIFKKILGVLITIFISICAPFCGILIWRYHKDDFPESSSYKEFITNIIKFTYNNFVNTDIGYQKEFWKEF